MPELRALPDRSVDLDNLPEGLGTALQLSEATRRWSERIGDYRALYERKVQQTDAQRAKLAEKLRRMKKKEQMSREKTKAKVRVASSEPELSRAIFVAEN